MEANRAVAAKNVPELEKRISKKPSVNRYDLIMADPGASRKGTM